MKYYSGFKPCKLDVANLIGQVSPEVTSWQITGYRLQGRGACGQVKGQITDYRFQSAGLGERAEQVTDYKFQTESAC